MDKKVNTTFYPEKYPFSTQKYFTCLLKKNCKMGENWVSFGYETGIF